MAVFFFQAEDGIRDIGVTGVQTCALPICSGGHGNTYSMRVPRAFPHRTFGDCQTYFGRTFGATLLALRDERGLVVSPPWDTPVPEGTTLYYVAAQRTELGQRSAGR